MKGNYFLGDRQFQVREMSFPPLGDFEVKIQNMAAGICGHSYLSWGKGFRGGYSSGGAGP